MSKNVLAIIKDDSKLNTRAMEINTTTDGPFVRHVIKELKETIIANNIVALAAPQLGYGFRIFCINFAGDIRAFINPVISKKEEALHFSKETCPSLPQKEFIMPRSSSIIAVYQTPAAFAPESNKFVDEAAFIFQQQVDILDGLLLSDYGMEVFSDFDLMSEDDKAKLFQLYIEHLKNITELCKKEVEASPNMKKMSDAIKFMAAVQEGTVTFEKKEELTKETQKGAM